MKGKYRHELKYNILFRDYLIIRPRIAAIMQSDPYANTNGTYDIHSIYFDNYTDKALREKADGVQKREKYRLRWYNDLKETIVLEKKMKVNNLCMKFSTNLCGEKLNLILKHDYNWMLQEDNELVREFYYRVRQQCLKPCVQVSYTREPFVYPMGNVRITFDSKISTSLANHNFNYESGFIPASNEFIMEVKYDEYLPCIIEDILQLGSLRQIAFSKYVTCRKYG